MADALARVTATLYRPDGSGVPTALLPLVGARVVATPVLLDETAAIIGSRGRVVGVTDAAGVLWQTDPPPAEGALPGLSLAPGSWSWFLPDRETIAATVTAGQVDDLLTLRGYVAPPGVTLSTLLVPALTDGHLLTVDGASVSGTDPAAFDPAGTAASAVAAHAGAADPHPDYTTAAEAATAAPVQSVAGRTGSVTLAVADVSGAVATTDGRLSDARTPTAHTHTLDATTDTATRVAMTPAERTKLGQQSGTNSGDQTLPTWTTLGGKPAVIAAGADAAAARAAIGAGTSSLALGTTAGTALEATAAPELIRDTMGTALVAGANVTITPNDPGDTITIAAAGGGGGATETLAYTYTLSATAYDGSAVSIDLATNVWTVVDHTFVNGDEVAIQSKRSAGNPAGTMLGRRYTIANVAGNTFTIQTAGANVDITGAGSTEANSWFISKTATFIGAEGLTLPDGHVRVKAVGNCNTGDGTGFHAGVHLNDSIRVADVTYERFYVDVVIQTNPFGDDVKLAKAEGTAMGINRGSAPGTNYITPIGMYAQGGNIGLCNDNRIFALKLVSGGNTTKFANGTVMEVYAIA